MATSPEYTQPTIEPVDDNTITFFPLDDLTKEKKGEEECRTPTGEEYRLVSVQETCPPAPRKKTVPASCKKRLMEVEILSVRFEEVEEWFYLRNGEAKAPPSPLDSKRKKKDMVWPNYKQGVSCRMRTATTCGLSPIRVKYQ